MERSENFVNLEISEKFMETNFDFQSLLLVHYNFERLEKITNLIET